MMVLLVINNNGNIGIGTDNPTQKLEINNVTAGASLLIRTSPSTSGGNLLFGDDASDTSGRVGYVHSSDHMYFSTNGSERLRIQSDGRIAIGTISDYSATVTDAPVYISMKSNITALGDDEGDSTYGLVRIEETGANNSRFHGIELRNKNAGDIRFLNQDVATSDRGDLVLVMPDSGANDGTHMKMRFNSLKSSIQISGKGGAVAANTATQHTDIYIATKTGLIAVDTGAGVSAAGLIRFEDVGTNNSRYHGIELRNKNAGDVRILNLDSGTTNVGSLVFAVDNDGISEAMRIQSNGKYMVLMRTSSWSYELHIVDTVQATANGHSQVLIGSTDDSGTDGDSRLRFLWRCNQELTTASISHSTDGNI